MGRRIAVSFGRASGLDSRDVKQQAAASGVIVADLYAERLIKTLGKANVTRRFLK